MARPSAARLVPSCSRARLESPRERGEPADSKPLPEPLDHDFIQALQEVLRGLAKVVLTTDDLRTALLSGGSLATLDEMKQRFGDYLDERAKGADPSKVRIVLE